jgi:hypothetical protein
MGIQLDWKIVAEQTQQREQEDPENKRRRRRRRMQLILLAVLVAVGVCAAALLLIWRVRSVEQHEENNLRASVEAEFTAIRIGDARAFMAIQRSDSDPWMNGQQATFAEYQTLKSEGRLSPDFQIVDVLIDKERGRVVIEEIIDQKPYRQAWFYWNYTPVDAEDSQAGWRRVPPDITFWGEEATIENTHSKVTYSELDELMAQALAPLVEEWWLNGCLWLGCVVPLSNLEVVIDPQAGLEVAWEPDNLGWRLRVSSPYLIGRVPADGSLPPLLEQKITQAIAERLIEYASSGRLSFVFRDAVIAYDTTWLKFQLRDWLAARFRGESSPFLDSAVSNFNAGLTGYIANSISDGSQINDLARGLDPNAASLTDLDLARLNSLDWRAFFSWRLELERVRLQADDLDNFFALYENGAANPAADARAYNAAYRNSSPETVNAVALSYGGDGRLIALVDATDFSGINAQFIFVWTGDTFIRQN